MIQTVTITSQGQISIPAVIRKKMNLNTAGKAYIRIYEDKIIVEPARDILDLAGAFEDKGLKGKSLVEILDLEKKSASEAVIENYAKK